MEALVRVVDDNLSASCLQGARFPLDDGVGLMDKSMYSLFLGEGELGGGSLVLKDVILPFSFPYLFLMHIHYITHNVKEKEVDRYCLARITLSTLLYVYLFFLASN